MILKNLLRRRTRTILTAGGIAVGVAAVVALGAILWPMLPTGPWRSGMGA
ncbi:MAG: hypothetical protein M1358_24360 [Chloroflexi bacterium]|nr:hypothetical protein [Chloroflexota bacterium]